MQSAGPLLLIKRDACAVKESETDLNFEKEITNFTAAAFSSGVLDKLWLCCSDPSHTILMLLCNVHQSAPKFRSRTKKGVRSGTKNFVGLNY